MSRIATFVAATTETIHQTWSDYVRYLQAKQVMLQVRDADVVFERDGANEGAQTTAHATLAALPPERRALFDAVLERERQRAMLDAEEEQHHGGGGGWLDPDAVEAQVVARLLDEAHGRGTPTEGRGWVPLSPDDDDWYEVDVAALQAAPQASAYTLRRADRDERQRGFVQAGVVLAVMLMALGAWWLWPRSTTSKPTDAPIARVNGRALEPWPLDQIVLWSDATTMTLPLRSTTSAVWQPSVSDTPHALWKQTALLPLSICVPAAALHNAAEAELGSANDLVRRSYSLTTTLQGIVDLVVQPCDDAATPPRYGVLRQTRSPAEQALNAEIRLGTALIRVASIQQLGPSEEPQLPQNTARVEVMVQTPASLDWSAFAPTLLLPDGQRLMASATDAISDGVVLRYLVPLPNRPRPVVWQLTPLNGAPVLWWRVTLPAPRSRDAVLRDQLRVEEATISTTQGERPTAHLILQNVGDTPLALVQSDIQLLHNDRLLPLPPLDALQAPLAAGEQRLLTVELALPDGTPSLILAVGPYRYALSVAEGR